VKPSTTNELRPKSADVRPNIRLTIVLAIVVGTLQSLCFPPAGLAFLLPFGIAAFLFLLKGLELKWAFRIGFIYGVAWYLGDLFWLSNIFGPAAISLCAILAFFTGLFAALYVWLSARLPQVPAWLLAATLWTGIEYFRSELFILKFGWLGLGYGVIHSSVAAACASCIGSFGLTFLLVSLAGLIADKMALGRKNLLVCAGLYILFIIAYSIPLAAPLPERPLRVRLVQAASEDDQSFFSLSSPLPDRPVDIVVWPEYSLVSDPTRQPRVWSKLAEVARANHAYFLFGAKEEINQTDPAAYRNTAFLLDPNGELAGKHVKNHTVHFFRDGVPGTIARAIPTSLGRLGVAICFDMDYQDVARRLCEDGAGVFLVPNDDPAEWGPIQHLQHRLMFEMRAAECARWLARADVAGGTSVAMPNGRESVHVNTTGPAKLEVIVGRSNSKTLFVRGGWLFGPINLSAVVTFCLLAFATGRAGKSKAEETRGRCQSVSLPISLLQVEDIVRLTNRSSSFRVNRTDSM